MTMVYRWAAEVLGLSAEATMRLLLTVVLLVGVTLGRWVAIRAVHRRLSEPRDHYRWRKGLTYAAVILALFLLSRIWLVDFSGFATYAGLVSAGVAIALKDPLASLAAWLFILWRRPFEVGDRIQLGDHSGDVVDLRLFQITLLEIGNWVHADQTTGRLLYLPNALVFTTPVANFTRGFRTIWIELPVLVTFESDWKMAEQILGEIVRRQGAKAAEDAGSQLAEAAGRFALAPGATEPEVYLTVEDSGVLLTIRTPCDPRHRRAVTQAIWRDVLEALDQHPEIDLAYPTTRIYRNEREGKLPLRAPDNAASGGGASAGRPVP
ncbi:MAG: mechanosensitive ion channel domain-containing protein [Gemmatimonadota bacterium]